MVCVFGIFVFVCIHVRVCTSSSVRVWKEEKRRGELVTHLQLELLQDRGQYLGYQRNVALDRLYVNWTDGTLLPVTSTPDWLTQVR